MCVCVRVCVCACVRVCVTLCAPLDTPVSLVSVMCAFLFAVVLAARRRAVCARAWLAMRSGCARPIHLPRVQAKPWYAAVSRTMTACAPFTPMLPAGDAVIIHLGTWHDFPRALKNPVVVMTMNSEEVVDALASAGSARPMDEGDVYKIEMEKAVGRKVEVLIDSSTA